jgi:hypothetical protein
MKLIGAVSFGRKRPLMPKPKRSTGPITVGDRVHLLGRKGRGIVRTINDIGWCRVEWDSDAPGPHIVDARELTKGSEDA